MSRLNEFRLCYESAFLFVLSHEYGISFATLLGMYNISDKMFWAYLSLLAPMSKMGVRKGGQLAKVANRIFKSIRGLRDRKQRKVEYEVTDENGNVVLDANGQPKKEKETVIEHIPIVLSEEEQKIKDVMLLYTTKGYSNGETFYSDDQVFDMEGGKSLKNNTLKLQDDVYSRCTKIEHIFEKHFPDLSTTDYRRLSIKNIEELISNLGVLEETCVTR